MSLNTKQGLFIEYAVKGLIFDAAVNAAYAASVAEAPILGLPIISTAYKYFLAKVANKIYTPIKETISLGVIKFETDRERQDYLASLDLYKDAVKRGTPDDINKAEENLKRTLMLLIQFRNS